MKFDLINELKSWFLIGKLLAFTCIIDLIVLTPTSGTPCRENPVAKVTIVYL